RCTFRMDSPTKHCQASDQGAVQVRETSAEVAASALASGLSSGGAWNTAWTLADQCVVSLGNFCTNMLLLRSLAVDDYRAFGLIYGVMLFLNTLHASLITYPLTVVGATRSDRDLRRLVGASVWLTTLLAVALSSGAAGAAIAVGRADLIGWVIAALLMWQL